MNATLCDHEILTEQEETELGTSIRRWKESENPPADVVKAGEAAVEKLILSNQKLVRKIAFDFGVYYSGHQDDLISEGNIGLMVAAERFDPTKGAKFSVYSSFWIKQRIMNYCRTRVGTIIYPSQRYQDRHQINQVVIEYREKHGVEPDAQIISNITGIAPNHIEVLLETNNGIVSIDTQLPSDEGTRETLANMIVAPAHTPRQSLVTKDNLELIIKTINALSPRERDVIKRRFGFGKESETLDEIGQTYDLTRERIRQIEEGALQKIKSILANYHINKEVIVEIGV